MHFKLEVEWMYLWNAYLLRLYKPNILQLAPVGEEQLINTRDMNAVDGEPHGCQE